MKFLADEDFPRPLVNIIRNFGYSVKTIQQQNLQGSSDEVVASIALKEKRVLLTFDKDFFKKQAEELSVVIFEFPRTPTQEIIPLIEVFLKEINKQSPAGGKILKFNKQGLHEW